MLRVSEAVGTIVLATCVLACPASAQERSPGALGEMPVPGGLQAAVAAIDDPVAPDRSQFLLEVIRRVHGNHAVEAARAAILTPLLSHLDAQGAADRAPPGAPGAAPRDTLPLPLPHATWSQAVFRRAVDPHALLAAILRSRDASLLYYGLLWLDEPTRAWIAGEPSLLGDITTRHAAAFVLAAPALRVHEGIVRVPGGSPAEAGWQALTAARVTEPAAFIRALLCERRRSPRVLLRRAGPAHARAGDVCARPRRRRRERARGGRARSLRCLRTRRERVDDRRAAISSSAARPGAARLRPARRWQRTPRAARHAHVLASRLRQGLPLARRAPGARRRRSRELRLAVRADLHGRSQRLAAALPRRAVRVAPRRGVRRARRPARCTRGRACGRASPGARRRARARAPARPRAARTGEPPRRAVGRHPPTGLARACAHAVPGRPRARRPRLDARFDG
jgi:hypothetical protein